MAITGEATCKENRNSQIEYSLHNLEMAVEMMERLRGEICGDDHSTKAQPYDAPLRPNRHMAQLLSEISTDLRGFAKRISEIQVSIREMVL